MYMENVLIPPEIKSDRGGQERVKMNGPWKAITNNLKCMQSRQQPLPKKTAVKGGKWIFPRQGI
jgi:hypothetical protein